MSTRQPPLLRSRGHRECRGAVAIILPSGRTRDFVGRSAYLERLRATFAAEPSAFLLHGEPGAGKSTLALCFAWEAQKDFDAVIFQLCGQRPLDAITAELADRLPIDVKMRPPDVQRAAAKEWLRQRQSLLILDDVWSPNVKQLEFAERIAAGRKRAMESQDRRGRENHTLPGFNERRAEQG